MLNKILNAGTLLKFLILIKRVSVFCLLGNICYWYVGVCGVFCVWGGQVTYSFMLKYIPILLFKIVTY